MAYWLFKSEPGNFSLDDLYACPQHIDAWNGVRNYQARNFLRDQIARGDRGFFYHSKCTVPGIVGTVEIVRAGYPDPTQWDPDSPYYDPKSTPACPRWFVVDVRFEKKFTAIIPLHALKRLPELATMPLVQRGNRLSVLPVSAVEWRCIQSMEPLLL